MPSLAAMRLFATPSPAISKALAWVTTRYGAVALRAHSVRAFRSARLNRSGAAGLFIRLEFFAGRIANARTRAAYGRAVGQFLGWCEAGSSSARSSP